jgi:FAD:protein FMN transferase
VPAIRRARPLLGTFVEIAIDGLESARALHAIDGAFDEIAAVHRLMSFHAAGSDLDRLHRAVPGSSVAVDARTLDVLDCAVRIAAASRGRFDPTIAARQVARGLLPRPASPWTPDVAADWRDIEFAGAGRVRLVRPLWIDLGGIAKGYAVDRAVGMLIDAGAAEVCVNAGGDLRVAGERAHTVHVRTPAGVGPGPDLELVDGAIATSSRQVDAEERRDERHGARTGAGPAWQTVSVVAQRCMIADALTKIVLAGDERISRHALAQYAAHALIRYPDRPPLALGIAA